MKNTPSITNPRYANGALRRRNRARLRAMGGECGICHGRFGPIHYDEPSDAAHPLSFVIDEIKPVSKWRQEGLRREVEDVAARDAYDEYEDVHKYVPYTETELAEMAAKKQAEEAEKAEREAAMRKAAEDTKSKAEAEAAVKAEQEAKIANIDAIEAQTTYTAMMTDTLMAEDT